MGINRRKVLVGAGIAGAAALSGAGVDRMLSGSNSGYHTGKDEPIDRAAIER
jgi:oxalate decarboxylase